MVPTVPDPVPQHCLQVQEGGAQQVAVDSVHEVEERRAKKDLNRWFYGRAICFLLTRANTETGGKRGAQFFMFKQAFSRPSVSSFMFDKN
jgi:hypothetical protein